VRAERIRKRDADELADCFSACARALAGHAYVITRGDQALADDLVQATFVAAAEDWRTVRSLTMGQRRQWLRTTLVNIAVSEFRRNHVFRGKLAAIERRYRPVEADTPMDALRAIALERCWQVIKVMPPRQHLIALMRLHEGMKIAEIAAALGLAEGTVNAHLHRARQKLITELGPYYPFARDDAEGEAS
jgi:RNA polymerase sigma-70 factor (ECF subfamily)